MRADKESKLPANNNITALGEEKVNVVLEVLFIYSLYERVRNLRKYNRGKIKAGPYPTYY